MKKNILKVLDDLETNQIGSEEAYDLIANLIKFSKTYNWLTLFKLTASMIAHIAFAVIGVWLVWQLIIQYYF